MELLFQLSQPKVVAEAQVLTLKFLVNLGAQVVEVDQQVAALTVLLVVHLFKQFLVLAALVPLLHGLATVMLVVVETHIMVLMDLVVEAVQDLLV
jgi:hypothetical protein